MSDIDPARLAGEGFTAYEEIPRPDDIEDPYVRGEAKNMGDYWPGPDRGGWR